MENKTASYLLSDFVGACGEEPIKVFIFKGAMETAKSDFNLNTQEAVAKFVATGGLEKPQFVNTKPWENNPKPELPVMVDAYHFSSGRKFGYVAFMFQDKTQKWSIKSLKSQSDPRNLAFATDALEEFKKQMSGGSNE